MKVTNFMAENANYEAPSVEIVEIAVELGFQASNIGVDGPSYGEEDVEW